MNNLHAVLLKQKGRWQHRMNKVKKLIQVAIIFALMFTLMPNFAKASNQVDISGGVKNEYDYEEYVFISGKPVKFTGSGKNVKVTDAEKSGKRTVTFNYSLSNSNGDTLSRKITYIASSEEYAGISQTVQNGTVTKASEDIKIDGVTYELVDYQFSNGLSIDSPPASDYYAGNIIATKIYEKKSSKTKERIVVKISSKNEGYDNFWGSTETQITTQEITFPNGTVGLIENRVASNKSRTLNYEENNAALSSFLGGYVMNSQASMVSQYKYNFGAGEKIVEARMDYTPVVERLIIPKFRDISTNFAKDYIEQLYSLGIYDDDIEYFSPNLKMQRYEFTIAIGKAIKLRVFEEELEKNSTTIFKDVARTKKDYQYLVAAYNAGVIKGISAKNFSPEGDLTREQAATILIRALGLEGRVQDSQVLLKYADRNKISAYAKAAVSEATRIGLINGYTNGTFNPKGKLTRAEAATLVARFLDYLNDDLNNSFEKEILFY